MTDTNKYFNSRKRHIIHLMSIPIYTIFFVAMFFVSKQYLVPTYIGINVFIVILLFHVIIYINYFFTSKNTFISYDNNLLIYTSKKTKENVVITASEIEKIKTVKSISALNNNNYYSPWDMFGYSVIYYKNGMIIINSLMTDDLDMAGINCPHEKVASLYPICFESTKI
jgi:hypothetical protein